MELKFRMFYQVADKIQCCKYGIMGRPDIVEFPVIAQDLQYSGLKDKNGTEIYEGDIISLIANDGQPINVVCEYGINRRDGLDIPSFYFKTKSGYGSYPIVNNHLNKHDCEIFEIIGNIHQNPELCPTT